MQSATERTVANSTAVAVQAMNDEHAEETSRLLDRLRVSVFGIQSARLYAALVADAVDHRIDCRIATASNHVCGVVIAAPRSYWRSCLWRHPAVAVACGRARLRARWSRLAHPRARGAGIGAAAVEHIAASPPEFQRNSEFDRSAPPLTWSNPGHAWRIIFVGTAPETRGLGIAASLYRSMMRDRSLVARIARDNHASIRLHLAVGWRLYADGDVVLAVHLNAENAV